MIKVNITSSLGASMSNQIKEYCIHYNGYKLKVLNIGATITEYSLDGHNICLSYANIEDYSTNPLYAGCIVGRTAGRIKNGCVGDWQLPKNYHQFHNHHGNGMHLAFYDVKVFSNKLELTTIDPEGDYPGNAKIKVVYSLGEEGLTQEISASSDKPTLFNFTNHSYFNLELGTSVLDHKLKIDADYYAHLDDEMFVTQNRPVDNTAFDFRTSRAIGSSFTLDDKNQFKRTKFIDHPFKLNGKLLYSNDGYQLEVTSDSDYVVIYAANYLSDCPVKLLDITAKDYEAICFETQKVPGDVELVTEFYSKTNYYLSKKKI